jgi:hypothetical protein
MMYDATFPKNLAPLSLSAAGSMNANEVYFVQFTHLSHSLQASLDGFINAKKRILGDFVFSPEKIFIGAESISTLSEFQGTFARRIQLGKVV